MLKIGNLSLRLPPGFAPRAATIAHMVGDELSRISWNKGAEISALRLPTLRLASGVSDQEVAQAVAAAIVRGVQGGNNHG
ncbi:MAG: hypothetical protein HGA78_08565 [Nitrospirales bacterium]|nr:hypothetical protein [Nitrospirales bacterium]